MAKLHDILMDALENGACAVWPGIWQRHVQNTVAQRAVALIDVEAGRIRRSWRELDDVRLRRKLLQGSFVQHAALASSIYETQGLRRKFNDLLVTKGIRQLNATSFRDAVTTVVPTLAQIRRAAKTITDSNPFPDAWPIVADLLAAELHRRSLPNFPDPEWYLLQGLLFVGFFQTCRLPIAMLVEELFREHASAILCARGEFLRIPERISPTGVHDVPVRVSVQTGTAITLSSAWLSPLIEATATEANRTAAGDGFLHRMIPIWDVESMPLSSMGSVRASQLGACRDATYRLYEHTVVGFLALSAIECLLRTWAFHLMTTRPAQISIFKANGQPNGVLDWIDDLNCGEQVRTVVKDLYDNDKSNIRNRLLHGNLLEIHAKRKEANLAIGDPDSFGWLRRTADPYSPANIARLCLECLIAIDAETATIPLSPGDAAWTQAVMLTPAEIELGLKVYCDFLGRDRELWVVLVTDYLNAVMPAMKQLFTMGFVEWLRGKQTVTPALGMLMGFSYEALHRLTVHLLDSDVTGTQGGTIQKSHEDGMQISHFQYRMLDARPFGICSPATIDRIVEHVPAADRATAREVFRLAMKARNALAHGALVQDDEATLTGMGHIFAKATQTLVTAGLHHLTKEAAYFIYLNEHPGVDGFDKQDWEKASKTITDRIRQIAKLNKL